MPNPQNIADKKFKKGQSGNPKGRPKKTYKALLDKMEEMGYVPPTREEYYKMVSYLLVMTEDDLKTISEDKSFPMWVQMLILDIRGKNTRQKVMDSYRDWLFGKEPAKQEEARIPTHEIKLPDGTIISF